MGNCRCNLIIYISQDPAPPPAAPRLRRPMGGQQRERGGARRQLVLVHFPTKKGLTNKKKFLLTGTGQPTTTAPTQVGIFLHIFCFPICVFYLWFHSDDYLELYVDTIKARVEAEDPSRPFLVSSPTNGIESEDEGYLVKIGKRVFFLKKFLSFLGNQSPLTPVTPTSGTSTTTTTPTTTGITRFTRQTGSHPSMGSRWGILIFNTIFFPFLKKTGKLTCVDWRKLLLTVLPILRGAPQILWGGGLEALLRLHIPRTQFGSTLLQRWKIFFIAEGRESKLGFAFSRMKYFRPFFPAEAAPPERERGASGTGFENMEKKSSLKMCEIHLCADWDEDGPPLRTGIGHRGGIQGVPLPGADIPGLN